jgi:glycosyltransferase involved in cell wall biosynthesis
MRILLATPLYPPEIGGPATYARFLEKELPPHGVAITVLPFSTVRRLPPGVRHLVYLFKLLALGRGADLIFAQDAYSVGLPSVAAATLLRRPLLIRVPGEYAWEQGVARFGVTDDMETFQKTRYGWRLELTRRIQSWTASKAGAIIVPSSFMQRIVIGWGIPESRVHRIENALVPHEPEAVESVAAPFALSAGRLVGGKGFEGLIRMMKDLPDWSLVIAGDGPLRGFLEAEVAREKLGERVRFLGRVSPGVMQGWYRAATAYVQNSRFESFSFQVAEALAAGTPTIATRVGGIPDLVEDGVNGVLVAPDDRDAIRAALVGVVEDPDLWRTRTEAGKRVVERLSPEHIVPQLLSLITDLAHRA